MKEKLFKKGITRSLFSVVLALAMVLSLMPATSIKVLAVEEKPLSLTVGDAVTYYDTLRDAVLAANEADQDCEIKVLKTCTFDKRVWFENKHGITITLNLGDAGTVMTLAANNVQDDPSWEYGISRGYYPLIDVGKSQVDIKGNGGKLALDLKAPTGQNGYTGISVVKGAVCNVYDGVIIELQNGGKLTRGLVVGSFETEENGYGNSVLNIYGGRILASNNQTLSTIVSLKRVEATEINPTVNVYGGEINWNVTGTYVNDGDDVGTYWAGAMDSFNAFINIYGGYINGPLWYGGEAAHYNIAGGMFTTDKFKNNSNIRDGEIPWAEENIGEGHNVVPVTTTYNDVVYKVKIQTSATCSANSDNLSMGAASVNKTSCYIGDTVKFTASPVNGYDFAGWKNESSELVSTDAEYDAFVTDKTLSLTAIFKAHEHNFTYTSNGATLTATCDGATCGLDENKVELTLTASSANYSGSAATITVGTPDEKTAWTGAKLTVPTTISYSKEDGTALDVAPTTAGSYVAKVSPVGEEPSDANTAKVSFTIEKNAEELLAAAKTEAKAAIDTAVGEDTTANVKKAADDAKAAIDAATTVAEVTTAKEAGTTAIQAAKDANGLATAKAEAKTAIDTAVGADDSENVKKAVDDAKNAIDKATTITAVTKAQGDGVKAIQAAKKVNVVVEKINAIGTVTYTDASKAKIKDARKAYDALTAEQKKLITNAQLKVLTDAEVQLAELEVTRAKKGTIIVPKSVKVRGKTFKITTIRKNAFHGGYVKKVVLQSTVKTINSKAFAGDNNLRTVEINSKKLTASKTAFKGVKKKSLAKIKVTVTKKMSKKDFNALKKSLVKQGLKSKNIVRK